MGFKDELIYSTGDLSTMIMATDVEEAISLALRSKMIAVVGLSRNPAKPSNRIASYLKSHGYHVVPVNPATNEVLGEKCYRSLLDLPDDLKRQIEVVDIFRRTVDVPLIVEQAIELHHNYAHPVVVWMQLGIVNEEAAAKARKAGLGIVMDRCMMVESERRRLDRSSSSRPT
jgi:predicted CoA-binding protein